jgi:hypothetical protein
MGLEICGALAADIDSLDVGTIEALFDTMKSIHARLDDGRPATAVFRTWLSTWSERGERFRLVYDPSSAFSSSEFSELNGDALKPLLTTTLKDIAQRSHSIFATGPLPVRGVLFGREGPLFKALSEQAPEAADLYLLLSADGDYGDSNGPFGEHWYWTGDRVPDAVTFPEVIDRARKRGDHALCDMLIGGWMLFCTLALQAPLPDFVGLAQRINALPTDYRSSVYAVLSLLKREAVAIEPIRRDMDALLSWLPLIDTAPPENIEDFLQELFSTQLWSVLDERERRRLVHSEATFISLRRLTRHERQPERFRLLIVDCSAVAELVLRRACKGVDSSLAANSEKPLGNLAADFDRALSARWDRKDVPRMHAARNGLAVLRSLNDINKRAGKHLGGEEITWEEVVNVHTGFYPALRSLLDVANSPLAKAMQ